MSDFPEHASCQRMAGRMHHLGCALLIMGLLAPGLSADQVKTAGESLRPDRIIPFKEVEGGTLHLHVFFPESAGESSRRPAIIFFFGGGWAGGTPAQFYEQARRMAGLGLVAISAEYRVSSRHGTTPLECVKDGKSAIRWVREHAEELGVDPDHIVASGGSAGGHVAVCTGLIQGLDEADEDQAIPSIPDAMILFNPVLDTTEKGFGAGRFPVERQTDLSPCHQVREGVGPTLVFHGTADRTVPFENAERFVRNMREAGNHCELVSYEGKGHGFFNAPSFRPSLDGADFESTLDHAVRFLDEHGYLPETGRELSRQKE